MHQSNSDIRVGPATEWVKTNLHNIQFDYLDLNNQEIEKLNRVIQAFHELVCWREGYFQHNLREFLSISEILQDPVTLEAWKDNARIYLTHFQSSIESNFRGFYEELLNILELNLSIEENQNRFCDFIQLYERIMNPNTVIDYHNLTVLLRQYYGSISEVSTIIGDSSSTSSSTVVNGITRVRRWFNNNDNNITQFELDDGEISIDDSDGISENLDLGDIVHSDINSFLYDLYNYINIDIFYKLLNNPDLPLINFVCIITLFCTTLIFLGWINIIRFLISDKIIEKYKIKEKYPILFKILDKSRTINYYILILDIILMGLLYFFRFFVCIDILIN